MRLLEFTDAETGNKFSVPEGSITRIDQLENESRCKVWYREGDGLSAQVVDESYDAVKVRLGGSE
jgi:hypothetical protein